MRHDARHGYPARSIILGVIAATVLLVVTGGVLPTVAGDARVSISGGTPAEPGDVPEGVAPETSPPFARIRFEEEGVHVVRQEGYEEDLTFNAPLYPGDRLETRAHQRVEVQLPDGALVRVSRRSPG